LLFPKFSQCCKGRVRVRVRLKVIRARMYELRLGFRARLCEDVHVVLQSLGVVFVVLHMQLLEYLG
jgi:hypothetical protein